MADYKKLSNGELIAKCLDEDALAWETLVRRYQRLISSIAAKYGLGPADAADVFQSVCLDLFRGLRSVRTEEKLHSWVIRVTARECYKLVTSSRVRKTKQLAVVFGDVSEDELYEIPDPAQHLTDEDLLELERQQQIRLAISQLEPRCQALIEELFYKNPPTPYSEIARYLSMAEGSVAPTRDRCLGKLRKILKKIGYR